MKMWATARALSALQWRYLCASWLLLPVVDLSLRLLGYRSTVAALERLGFRASQMLVSDSRDLPEQIAQAVSIAARRSIWPTSCLRQALLLWWFLGRRGVSVEVRIGADVGGGRQFAAHAWVERDGGVLLGGEHVRKHYVVLL